MHWQYTPFAIPNFAAAIVAAAIAIVSWRRRAAPGAVSFTLLMASVAWWSAAYGLEVLRTDLPGKLALSSLEYVGSHTVPVFWLTMALAYTGREEWVTARNIALLLIAPLITIVLAWPVLSLFLSILPRAAEVLAWLDINAVAALGDGVTAVALARVATGIVVWIIVPGIIGVARELRTEVR